MTILITSIFLVAIIGIFFAFNREFIKKHSEQSHFSMLLGFQVFMGLFFVVNFMVLFQDIYPATISYGVFALCLGIYLLMNFKLKQKVDLKQIGFILLMVLIFFVISLKFRLGEQLGDNSYLTSMVTMNVNVTYFNHIDFASGFKSISNIIGPIKSYLSWYHSYAILLTIQQKIFHFLKIAFIPPYILFVWVGNLLFYILSGVIYYNFITWLKIKSIWMYGALASLVLYWNTIYYNLVLAYYGTNFISIFVIGLWIMMVQLQKLNRYSIWLFIFGIYAITSMGNVGIVVSAYLVFSFVVNEILNKNESIFYWIPFLLIPIFHWIWIMNDWIPLKFLFPLMGVVSIVSWCVHYLQLAKYFIFKYIIYILGITLVSWYALAYFTSDNYWVLFNDFFAIKSNFDRLQDYFSFINLNDSLRNIAFYFALGGLFLSEKTRKVGWMVLIIFLFFINPIVYPMLYPPLQWLYHRAYISIFNMFVIMMGIYGLFDYLLRFRSQWRYVFMVSWMLLLVPSTYQQITGYFHPIYKPGPDFNVIYKLDNAEIEVLEKLRQIVDVEKYENAKVISQIYATTMYVPDVYQMYFNVYNHRAYDENTPDESYDDLYRIFFTPVYAGDDGPRFNAPYKKTCDLIISNQVDFIIYEKKLSAYDENTQNWIPIHWYARGCAEQVIENDRFIMYRFYWK